MTIAYLRKWVLFIKWPKNNFWKGFSFWDGVIGYRDNKNRACSYDLVQFSTQKGLQFSGWNGRKDRAGDWRRASKEVKHDWAVLEEPLGRRWEGTRRDSGEEGGGYGKEESELVTCHGPCSRGKIINCGVQVDSVPSLINSSKFPPLWSYHYSPLSAFSSPQFFLTEMFLRNQAW